MIESPHNLVDERNGTHDNVPCRRKGEDGTLFMGILFNDDE